MSTSEKDRAEQQAAFEKASSDIDVRYGYSGISSGPMISKTAVVTPWPTVPWPPGLRGGIAGTGAGSLGGAEIVYSPNITEDSTLYEYAGGLYTVTGSNERALRLTSSGEFAAATVRCSEVMKNGVPIGSVRELLARLDKEIRIKGGG